MVISAPFRKTNNLQEANGSQIATFNKRTFTVEFGSKSLRLIFTLGKVKHLFLGADSLPPHGLEPDLSRGLLVDLSNLTIIRGGLTAAQNARLVATTSNVFGDPINVNDTHF